MRICIILMLATTASSITALGVLASPRLLQRISKAYPLLQALRDSGEQLIEYRKTSGELLENIGSWLESAEYKEQIRNLTRNIDRHRQGRSFISAETVENIKTVIDNQEAGEPTFAGILFLQLHNALHAEIAAEGLLKQVAKNLLDEDKYNLFDKLLTTDAIADEQLRQVLHEVLPNYAEEKAEELFKGAQQIIKKRNKAINTVLADNEPRRFYAYIKEDSKTLFHMKDGIPDSDRPFDERNIIVFGETKKEVKKRVSEQAGRNARIVAEGKLPFGLNSSDKIVMKFLAQTSDFRRVSVIRGNGTKNTEAFVLVDGNGNIKDLAANQEVVEEKVARALAVLESNYLYRSLFKEQKITPYLELSYEGADHLEFKKSAIIAELRAASDLTQLFANYGEHMNNNLVRQQLGEIYRAKEEVRNDLKEEVMDKIDTEFRKLLDKEYKLPGSEEARKITLAEIERQAAVLDLLDVADDKFKDDFLKVTKSEFNDISFKDFISGKYGIPEVVSDLTASLLSDSNLEDSELWKALTRLRHYSFAKEDIIFTLQNVKAENIAKVFAIYGEQLNGKFARQRLGEIYRAKEAVRNDQGTVMKEIDDEFRKLLDKKYNLKNSEEARKMTLAEIERQVAVLDLLDVADDKFKDDFFKVTGSKFNTHIFSAFILKGSDITNKVRDFSKIELTDDQWKALTRLRHYSFDKEDIMFTMQNVKAENIENFFANYGEHMNDNLVRQQLGEIYRAKEEVRNDLDEKVMDKIDTEFRKLLDKKYKLPGSKEARYITLEEIERQAAVFDLLDIADDKFKDDFLKVTKSEFNDISFKGFISGRYGIPEVVSKYFNSTEKQTAEHSEIWKRLQQLDEQKVDIVLRLENLKNEKEAKDFVATYGKQLNRRARQRLADLYRAIEVVRKYQDKEVMRNINTEFGKLLDKKYKLPGSKETGEITLAEIERWAAVLDLRDIADDTFKRDFHKVTRSKFNDVSFKAFKSGKSGIPEVVSEYFTKVLSDDNLKNSEQWKVWKRFKLLDEQQKKARKAANSFDKENIMDVMQNVNSENIEKFLKNYGERLNQYARRQLAELYRAIEAVRNDLDEKVMWNIDTEFGKLLDKKYKLPGSKEARDITLEEIERQAAVFDLLDIADDKFKDDFIKVTKSEFNDNIFYGFISRENGIPEVVSDYFKKVLSDDNLKNSEQWKVWKRFKLLDEQQNKARKAANSFDKENIVAVLHKAKTKAGIEKVFKDYGEQLNQYARRQLADLYRAIEVVRKYQDKEVMRNINTEFGKLLDKKYKLPGSKETGEITLAEIERWAAVLDLRDIADDTFKRDFHKVTRSKFNDVSFKAFKSGKSGIPVKVRNYFSEREEYLSQAEQEVWERFQLLDT